MNDYINMGKKILKTLNNNGFEAYFIGEAVRNFILEKHISSVHITTNASVSTMRRLFMDCEIESISATSVIIHYEDYKFYLNTFVTNPTEDSKLNYTKHYSKNLLEDLSNRDFTINAIAMSHSGKTTDPYNGYSDVLKKKIRHIGKGKNKFLNNPSLIIKAFTLMSELDYDLSLQTKREITKRRKYLYGYDVKLYADELRKIVEGQYATKAILMMNKTNLDMVIPSFKKVLRLLGSHYKKVNFQDVLMCAFIMNGKIDKQYVPYIDDQEDFMKVYKLASMNKTANFDDITLFRYGLDYCLKANRINNILRYCPLKTKKLTKKWKALKVKNADNLLYGPNDIKKIIKSKDYYIIDEILMEVCVSIIAEEITNSAIDIQNKVIELLEKNNIEYSLNGFYEGTNEVKTKEVVKNRFSELDAINQHLIYRQQKITEEAEEIEKNNEMRRNNASNLEGLDLTSLYEHQHLKGKIKNNKEFEKELHKFISGYIETEDEEVDNDEND